MRSEEYRAMFDLEDRLWWYQGMRAVTASILTGSLRETESLRLLDVGCGTGFSLTWLRERFTTCEAFGVDVSPHAAAFWRQRELDTAAVASATALPFAAGAFDLVTCFDVIYQLTPEGANAAAAETFRVLRPGGFLFIREPAYEWLRGKHDIAVGTHHRYTLAELRRLLSRHGFVARRATYANTLLFGAAVPHRLLSRLKGGTGSDVKPVPEWMNRAMVAALRLEARLLARLTFPFGLSAIVLAQKPE
ncbi:MAG TPA: methyltransferase domain-containing protein [Blastocatellia bacterium]|nr:methyltransferase domain-containing protein [Blastocatellia bacterium]